MKILAKKIGAALLMLCLGLISFSFVTFAAEGTLQFTDPSAAAGDMVTITAKVDAGGAVLGDVDVTLKYDATILKFVKGTNASGGEGTVTLSSKGDGTATESSYSLEFQALKEGTATLDATGHTAYLASDEALNLALGSSTVTIAGGTPVTDTESQGTTGASAGGMQLEVDGISYTVNENFTEAAIPKGFAAGELDLDGKTTKAMVQQTSGQYVLYVQDAEGNPGYILYSADDGSYTVTEVIDVNSNVSIFLMNHTDTEGLPSEYKETTTNIGGKTFSAWQNVSSQEYYLVYALSSEGTKGYYQYDTTEKTYQRYVLPVTVKEETKNTLTDKIMNVVEKNLTVILCIIWGVFLILLIVLIVLAVKLGHRNQELDDLYDEYGYGDGGGEAPKAQKKNKKQFVGYKEDSEEYEDDDEYDEEYEDESDEEYEDDEYEEDEYEDDEYEDDEYEDEEYEDDDYEEDEFEEYEDEPSASAKGKRKDDYSVDFIDI